MLLSRWWDKWTGIENWKSSFTFSSYLLPPIPSILSPFSIFHQFNNITASPFPLLHVFKAGISHFLLELTDLPAILTFLPYPDSHSTHSFSTIRMLFLKPSSDRVLSTSQLQILQWFTTYFWVKLKHFSLGYKTPPANFSNTISLVLHLQLLNSTTFLNASYMPHTFINQCHFPCSSHFIFLSRKLQVLFKNLIWYYLLWKTIPDIYSSFLVWISDQKTFLYIS